ncbi:MAG: type IV pilin protein [Dokdonella sp.]
MNKQRGFTLIELMVVVAIVAILAAIAIPSYLSQTRKSRRSSVESALQSAGLAEEKVRADCATYANSFTAAPTGCTTTMGGNPYTGAYYTVGAPTNATGTSYTITATAISGKTQVSDKAQGTSCSTVYYAFGADATVNAKCSTATAAGRISKCPEICWGN